MGLLGSLLGKAGVKLPKGGLRGAIGLPSGGLLGRVLDPFERDQGQIMMRGEWENSFPTMRRPKQDDERKKRVLGLLSQFGGY